MEKNLRIRGVVCRLYSPSTKEKLWQSCNSNRFVWNFFLARRIKRYEKDKPTSYKEDATFLTKLKNKKYKWLKNVSSVSLQQTLKDLDQAFQNFFRRVKKGENPGFPKFKKKFKSRNSFRIVNKKDIRLKDNILKIPKVGNVKITISQDFNIDNVKSYTIFEDCGKWFVSFIEYFKPKKFKKTKSQIGIDLGVKKLIYPSKGKYINPFKNETLERRIKTKQKDLSRKTKQSNNWIKCKQELKLLHQKLRWKHKDYLHKVSTILVNNHDLIVVETLKTRNMTRSAKGTINKPGKNVRAKSGLNRSILKQGWNILLTMLEYKCDWYGKTFIKVDPKYTSQTCSSCGHVSKKNRRSQKSFKCISCGFQRNADRNAAKNILNKGLILNKKRVGLTLCGGTYRVPTKQESRR